MRSVVVSIVNWQWPTERIIKTDPLTATWDVAKDLNADHSTDFWHLKQIGKVKKLAKWVPHELTASQKKIIVLKCHLFFYAITNHFSWSDYDMQWKVALIWQPVTTSSVAGLRRSSEALPKAKLALQKGPRYWWSAAGLIHYSFLNPSEAMLSEK